MKIFAYSLRPYDELGYLESLANELGFDFDWTPEYPTLENTHLAAGAQGVTIITNPMPAEVLSAYHELGVKAIGTRSIGYDHIDVAHAHKIGMRVSHAIYPPEGVANYAIMLILMTLRKAKLITRLAGARDFGLEGKIGRDISGCTVGIVGTGAIGATVARHLTGFGCRIIASDPYPKAELEGIVEYKELPELLAEADVVTLHAPGLPQNFHLIGKDELALMKQGAVIVNTARGTLIDTEALLCALEEGHLGGAALDTIESEANLYYRNLSREILPNRDLAALEALPNVIVTPHMAFYTAEAVENMMRTNAEALLALANGQNSPYEVK